MRPPDIRVTRARPVFGDGRHNSSPAIAAAGDDRVLVCQTATDHLSNDGVVTVLSEDDGWAAVETLRAPPEGRHLRDPSAVGFDGELLVYADAVADATTTPQAAVPVVAASADGPPFGEPRQLEGVPDRHRMYDVRQHEGLLYATVRGPDGGLYSSRDGRRWERVTAFPVEGNEVAIDFDAAGRLWALARDAVGPCPAVCTAPPPYDEFDETEEKNVAGTVIRKRLQGPMVERLDGGVVIVGREYDRYGGGKHNTTTNIWWRADDREPVLVRALPSGGDTSYGDWLELEPGRALVPYYSGHTYRMNLPHEEDDRLEESRAYAEQHSPADIYLADVSYPAELSV